MERDARAESSIGPLVTARGVTKRFGDRVAVDGINFSIQRGEIFGLLGPNGAGKSTTVNMLSTYLPPDSGEISIDGNPPPVVWRSNGWWASCPKS
jgi:ABC-type multidrug transport system ATPase subunit